MAKSSSSRSRQSKSDRYVGRETSRFANQRLPQRVYLRDIEDRRLFHPEGPARPARTVRGLPAKVRVSDPRPRVQSGLGSSFGDRWSDAVVPYGLTFKDASRVLVCARREQRRQVLHARGVAGSKNLQRPRFNLDSKISCKG